MLWLFMRIFVRVFGSIIISIYLWSSSNRICGRVHHYCGVKMTNVRWNGRERAENKRSDANRRTEKTPSNPPNEMFEKLILIMFEIPQSRQSYSIIKTFIFFFACSLSLASFVLSCFFLHVFQFTIERFLIRMFGQILRVRIFPLCLLNFIWSMVELGSTGWCDRCRDERAKFHTATKYDGTHLLTVKWRVAHILCRADTCCDSDFLFEVTTNANHDTAHFLRRRNARPSLQMMIPCKWWQTIIFDILLSTLSTDKCRSCRNSTKTARRTLYARSI